MDISSEDVKIKILEEVILFSITGRDSVSMIGGFHLASGNVVERATTDTLDPDSMEVVKVTACPLSVKVKVAGSVEDVTLDAAPTRERHLSVVCALVRALAKRDRSKAGVTGGGAAGQAAPPGLTHTIYKTRKRPAPKLPPGRSFVNPSARKRTTERGLEFDSGGSQE